MLCTTKLYFKCTAVWWLICRIMVIPYLLVCSTRINIALPLFVTREMLYHPKWAGIAHCTDLCHGAQTMNSSRVCGCLLSVRAATMATYAWTKLHTRIMSCISAIYEHSLCMALTWNDLSHRAYRLGVVRRKVWLPWLISSNPNWCLRNSSKVYFYFQYNVCCTLLLIMADLVMWSPHDLI